MSDLPSLIQSAVTQLETIRGKQYEDPSVSATKTETDTDPTLLSDKQTVPVYDCNVIQKYASMIPGWSGELNKEKIDEMINVSLGLMDTIHDFWPGPRTGENKKTQAQEEQTSQMLTFLTTLYNKKFNCQVTGNGIADDGDAALKMQSILENCMKCKSADRILPNDIEKTGEAFIQNVTKLRTRSKVRTVDYTTFLDTPLTSEDVVFIKEDTSVHPDATLKRVLGDNTRREALANKIREFFGVDMMYINFDSYQSVVGSIFKGNYNIRRVVTPQNVADSAKSQVLNSRIGMLDDIYHFPDDAGQTGRFTVKSNYFSRPLYELSYINKGFDKYDRRCDFSYIFKHKGTGKETVIDYDIVKNNTGPSVNYLYELHHSLVTSGKWPAKLNYDGVLHTLLDVKDVKENYLEQPVLLDVKRGGDYDQIDAMLDYNRKNAVNGVIATSDRLCAVKARTQKLNAIRVQSNNLYLYKVTESLSPFQLTEQFYTSQFPVIQKLLNDEIIGRIRGFHASIQAAVASYAEPADHLDQIVRKIRVAFLEDTYAYLTGFLEIIQEVKKIPGLLEQLALTGQTYNDYKQREEMIQVIYSVFEGQNYNRIFITNLLSGFEAGNVEFDKDKKYSIIDYDPVAFKLIRRYYSVFLNKVLSYGKANGSSLGDPVNFDQLIYDVNQSLGAISTKIRDPQRRAVVEAYVVEVAIQSKEKEAEVKDVEGAEGVEGDDTEENSIKLTQLSNEQEVKAVAVYLNKFLQIIDRAYVSCKDRLAKRLSKAADVKKTVGWLQKISANIVAGMEGNRKIIQNDKPYAYLQNAIKLAEGVNAEVTGMIQSLSDTTQTKTEEDYLGFISNATSVYNKLLSHNNIGGAKLVKIAGVDKKDITGTYSELHSYLVDLYLSGIMVDFFSVTPPNRRAKLEESDPALYLKTIKQMLTAIDKARSLVASGYFSGIEINPDTMLAKYEIAIKDYRLWGSGLDKRWETMKASKVTIVQSGGALEDTEDLMEVWTNLTDQAKDLVQQHTQKYPLVSLILGVKDLAGHVTLLLENKKQRETSALAITDRSKESKESNQMNTSDPMTILPITKEVVEKLVRLGERFNREYATDLPSKEAFKPYVLEQLERMAEQITHATEENVVDYLVAFVDEFTRPVTENSAMNLVTMENAVKAIPSSDTPQQRWTFSENNQDPAKVMYRTWTVAPSSESVVHASLGNLQSVMYQSDVSQLRMDMIHALIMDHGGFCHRFYKRLLKNYVYVDKSHLEHSDVYRMIDRFLAGNSPTHLILFSAIYNDLVNYSIAEDRSILRLAHFPMLESLPLVREIYHEKKNDISAVYRLMEVPALETILMGVKRGAALNYKESASAEPSASAEALESRNRNRERDRLTNRTRDIGIERGRPRERNLMRTRRNNRNNRNRSPVRNPLRGGKRTTKKNGKKAREKAKQKAVKTRSLLPSNILYRLNKSIKTKKRF